MRLGEDAAADPLLAHLAFQVINTWSHVELEMANIANTFLTGSFVAVSAMFQTISGRFARRNALIASASAAESVPDEDVKLLSQVLGQLDPVGDRRNEYAHSIRVYSPSIPASFLLINQRYLASADARDMDTIRKQDAWEKAVQEAWVKEQEPPPGPTVVDWTTLDRREINVFTEDDIRMDIKAMGEAVGLMAYLFLALRGGPRGDGARSHLEGLLPKRQRKRNRSMNSAP